jgi:propionyl-CoA carboxylase alpha chain
MFEKILIANRGEIACRVIKTARRLGIATVAVHSDADVHALHVREADEAVEIGPAPAAQSYLVIEKIIEACRATGAQAVHPGYGFLSENAEFNRALDKAGLTFIGPNLKAIEVMGDKIASKKFADDAKVSTVPGHPDVIADTGEAIRIAEQIGYPVMIKASAGGGGKGMRIARTRQDVEEGFSAAVSEAKSSFGDDRVFIEKFIDNPRHIEIQVLCDSYGRALYLGERECSIQRRNQKVIEEAPSSFLDAKTRKAMGEQAVALAKAVDYVSAGTVEFIVDQNKNFYFLEMNTRLQVEHPVTELITGIDLVEQMIRVAAGEKLKLTQSKIKLDGWAVESRIYAEDPARGFLPSTGRLTLYRPPEEGTRDGLVIRNDTGVYEGAEISIHYDPMIAKLCTHGPDRARAIGHMSRALDEFLVSGVETNIDFLANLMGHPRWLSGDISTGFLDQEYGGTYQAPELPDPDRLIFASVAAAVDHVENRRKRKISGQMSGKRVTFSNSRVVWLGEGEAAQAIPVHVADDGGPLFRISHIDQTGKAGPDCVVETTWAPGMALWRGWLDGELIAVQLEQVLNGKILARGGYRVAARVYTGREAELAALMPVKQEDDLSKFLLCPMPGLLISLSAEPGQAIKAGEALCVVEAMKMENILRAKQDGVVKTVKHQPGDALAVDDVIMEFE